jgi:hypothetical protein
MAAALFPFCQHLPKQYTITTLSILLFVAVCGVVFAFTLVPATILLYPLANLAIDIVIALMVADFVGALIHWFEDTYTYNQPLPSVLGKIAKDNKVHHHHPHIIVSESYWQNSRYNVIGSVIVCILAASAHQLMFTTTLPVRRLVLTGAAMSMVNLVHRFSHEKDSERPAVITWLQSWLLVSSDEHSQHHSMEQRNTFSVFLKGTNSIYDSLGIWRIAEGIIAVTTGLNPLQKPRTF